MVAGRCSLLSGRNRVILSTVYCGRPTANDCPYLINIIRIVSGTRTYNCDNTACDMALKFAPTMSCTLSRYIILKYVVDQRSNSLQFVQRVSFLQWIRNQ